MHISESVLRDFSRRVFLKAAGGAAAVATVSSSAAAIASGGGSLSKKEQFLLDRLTFGRTPDLE